jgi:hypothetical protein
VQQLHQLWQARSVRLERPPAASHGASLPRGVELNPGSLQITFETPAGLLQTLYGLATQAARDWSVFENLISSSLPLVK